MCPVLIISTFTASNRFEFDFAFVFFFFTDVSHSFSFQMCVQHACEQFFAKFTYKSSKFIRIFEKKQLQQKHIRNAIIICEITFQQRNEKKNVLT